MYTQEEINLIILSSFEELTYNCKYMLLSALSGSEPDFVKYRQNLIKSVGDGVYNKVKERFYDPLYRAEILEGLEKRGIKCITLLSDGYPESLKNIQYPPITLYCKGKTELLKTRCFSAVGSRRTLPAALKICKKVARDLTRHFTVVTGMADGADAAAAEGAMESGKIISVLAYGFDYFYPAINEQLIKKVAASGLLVSEYPPYVAPKSYYFPVRNRIIAGLSEGTLIVSAGSKSGALITADYAAEYGRHVFAFPYSIGVASGEGNNSLIKNGAMLCESAQDILFIFGLDYVPSEVQNLSSEESELLSLIRSEGAAFIPVIAEKLKKQPYQIAPLLTSLEMKGKIVRLGGNRYSAV